MKPSSVPPALYVSVRELIAGISLPQDLPDRSAENMLCPPLRPILRAVFKRVFGPVDPRHPEAYPAWRRLLTPMMFFRCVSDDGVAAWLHNVACRYMLVQAAIVRIPTAFGLFWISATIARWSALVSVPFWILMLTFAVQSLVYMVIWGFLRQDVEFGAWDWD